MSDFKYALRGLRRRPLFALIAVASLALGLGANAAIFTLLDHVMFRPLPVERPSELVVLSSPGTNMGRVTGRDTFSWPMYKDLRDNNPVFAGLAARYPEEVNLRTGAQAEPANAEVVSGNYFQVLGVKAHLGRLIQPADDVTVGGHAVVVLSYDYWRNHLGADPKVAGRIVRMNNHPMTVIGVAKAGFFGVERGRAAQAFIPVTMKAWVTPTWDTLTDRRSMWLGLIGRLKPGISIEQAESGLLTVYRPLLEKELAEFPTRPSARFAQPFLAKRIELEAGAGGIPTLKREAGAPAIVLMSMTLLVLLIACANVAGLLVARAAARQKEMAVRLALGAGGGDLFRQTLAESLVLAVLGGLAAAFVAAWTMDGISLLLPAGARQGGMDWRLDGRVLAFLALLTLAAALLSGFGPALRASKGNLANTLKDQGGALAGAFGALKARRFLVVTQVALSLLLVAATGLFARTLLNLRNVDPGFPVERTLTFSVDVSRAGYPLERAPAINAAIEERLSALPGVAAVASAEVPVLSNSDWSSTIRVEGYSHKEDENMNPAFNTVSAGFFKAMKIPVVAGREFGPQDAAGGKAVAVVNETFARYFFDQTNPLGRRFTIGDRGKPFEIIGVVKNSKQVDLRQADRRFAYLAWRQSQDLGGLTFYLKTAMDAAGIAPALRREIEKAAPGVAMGEIRTLEQVVEASLAGERVVAYLCLLFAVLATLLSAVGLYGVMAYSVERRTREIGLRVALGAARGSVIGMVLSEAMKMALGGALLGLPLFYGLSRLVRAQLYGLAPHDPATVVWAVIVILAAVALAAFGPAYRASRTDPMTALRYE